MPPMVDLQRSREKLTLNSLEPSTRDADARAYRHWIQYTSHYTLDPTPTPDSLSLFITWRFQVSVSVPSLLSGLAFHLRPLISAPTWDEVSSSPQVKMVLRGGRKSRTTRIRKVIPLPHAKLQKVILSFLDNPRKTYDDLLWAAPKSPSSSSAAVESRSDNARQLSLS